MQIGLLKLHVRENYVMITFKSTALRQTTEHQICGA